MPLGGVFSPPGIWGFSLPYSNMGGADYAHRIIACPPGFENLTASLISCDLMNFKNHGGKFDGMKFY